MELILAYFIIGGIAGLFACMTLVSLVDKEDY